MAIVGTIAELRYNFNISTTHFKVNMEFHPLFPQYKEFSKYGEDDYYSPDFPSVTDFINRQCSANKQVRNEFTLACQFLYRCGLNSEATYTKLRSEIERFLLWSWTVRYLSVNHLLKKDIEAYINFCVSPPPSLIGKRAEPRFEKKGEVFLVCNRWRPFVNRGTSQLYGLSQKSIKEIFSNLSMFFNYLIENEYLTKNFIPAARKGSNHIVKGKLIEEPKHFSEELWDTILGYIETMAELDSGMETALFVVVTMKSLYLRVSEISVRDNWRPVMGHFFKDSDDRWWLKILGKGNKERKVSVPDAYLPYLKRYREYRGLTGLPLSNEKEPLLEKKYHSEAGNNFGYSNSRLRQMINETFELCALELIEAGKPEKAAEVKGYSSHVLRHTGASHDSKVRPLRDLAEDLGHSKGSTTEEIYIHSGDKQRHESGRTRKI